MSSLAGSAASCLQFLSQRAASGFAPGRLQSEGNSLETLQGGTLALFYFAYTNGDRFIMHVYNSWSISYDSFHLVST